MKAGNPQALFQHLIVLCKEVSEGEYRDMGELFELTKAQLYPPLVAELAESFGMMTVRLEAREYLLEEVITDLKKIQQELAAAKEALARENVSLKHSLKRSLQPTQILGASAAILYLLKKIDRIAGTPVNVLITGETGTGKELVARTIHDKSARRGRPFIALNCTAIPESIFESEIFGIEKGVATGVEKRIGKLEQAQGGTIFFDEVGDMPLAAQGKILRVIEDRQVERIGGRTSIPADVRILAATNRNLKERIAKGIFREDLYYRLNVVNLHIPPLRERPEDISLLLDFFSERGARMMGRTPISFSPEARERLGAYSWPGNVRELENEVERAIALASGREIGGGDLSENVLGSSPEENLDSLLPPVKRAERLLLEKTLRSVKGNKSEAARLLGLSREGLRRKLLRYELK
ncbi:MAG TPA: sigma-54 dependent transcriptional regulator [Syntrophales bacterium]|nr:sigma-54 dependent transcriptional regulator [Syntrophales bacterium]HPN08733.1 sigma-54 dependent transcriptional regulator [Syntrophales bacterium]